MLASSMGTLEKNPGQTLESWKQIAAHLNRSERTVRLWEAAEGLPVRRREHQKQDTVFAYSYEIDEWNRRRIRKQLRPAQRTPEPESPRSDQALSCGDKTKISSGNRYLAEHDAITRAIDLYIAGGRAGQGDLMRPAFHPEATIAGYCFGVEYSGSIEHLFRWINENGPAPRIEPRFARIRDLRNHRNRTPGSPWLVREISWAQRPPLRGLHAPQTR